MGLLMKIYLICPICGSSNWKDTESVEFECEDCGAVVQVEDVIAEVDEEWRKSF